MNYDDSKIYERIFHQARMYLSLVENYIYDENDIFMLNPIYVNMLFACELYLKALLIYNGKTYDYLKSCKHNFCKLYNSLELSQKQNLKERFECFYKLNIDKKVGLIEDDFVSCRYMFFKDDYENKKMRFNAVENLMSELEHMVSVTLYGKDTLHLDINK